MQEKRQLPELEHELRQCGGGSERATVDGSIVHDDAKDLELGKIIVAGSRLRVASWLRWYHSQMSELNFQMSSTLMVGMICRTKADFFSLLTQ